MKNPEGKTSGNLKKPYELAKYKIIPGGLYNVYRKYGTEKREYQKTD